MTAEQAAETRRFIARVTKRCALCEAARRGWPLAEGLEDWTASYARKEDKNYG